MKRSKVVLALPLILAVYSRALAEESLEFTLEEVDAASAPPPKPAKHGKAKAAAVPAVDLKKAFSEALGERHWGMSKADVLKMLKAQIRVAFEKRIKLERDIMRQDALYQESQEAARRLNESFVSFDGPKTGWDVSPIAQEFTHKNRETMLVVNGKSSRDFYFFIQGKLWKWYRELPSDATYDGEAEPVVAKFEARFGKGKRQMERRNDSQLVYPGAVWTDGSTRVTALQRGSEACVIYEDQATIDQLAVLRNHVEPKAKESKVAATIDAILLTGAKQQ